MLACACATPGASASAATDEPTISGGVRAVGYEEAAVIDRWDNGGSRPSCSGAIIAPRVVLTARHCGGSWPASTTSDIAGLWHVTIRGGTPGAKRVQASAGAALGFGPAEGGDVGLLFLDEPGAGAGPAAPSDAGTDAGM